MLTTHAHLSHHGPGKAFDKNFSPSFWLEKRLKGRKKRESFAVCWRFLLRASMLCTCLINVARSSHKTDKNPGRGDVDVPVERRETNTRVLGRCFQQEDADVNTCVYTPTEIVTELDSVVSSRRDVANKSFTVMFKCHVALATLAQVL